MSLTILFISLFIFFNNLGYCVYAFQAKNKLAGFSTLVLNIFMILLVNFATFQLI